ncbi:LolA-like protein [Algoriphagus chordae]|uniref:Outer membrane lipoprotein-sorting protein n=1 Tax=Algoriphagus chordae TaxID=237019 RepID=A0A2W7QZ69_9BACT|nr:peptidase, M16 family protein [Algoriphagus chordae]PZX47109.1 hypothetical protein LV85_04067 [Algoriphagus chordae]
MKKSIVILALGLCTLPMATQAKAVEKEVSAKVAERNSVKEVIDRYVKATGGEAKMRAVRNMEMNMEAEIQGMLLDISSVIDQENQRLLNLTEMNGEVVSKTVLKDGAGVVSAMGQEQILTEEQVGAMSNQIYAFRELYLDELGVTASYEGIVEVAGEQAYKLNLDAGGEANTSEYYSVETGLKLQTESAATGIVQYKAYKEVDGIMMPMTMVITSALLPMPLEAKITTIKFNQDLDDSVFN